VLLARTVDRTEGPSFDPASLEIARDGCGALTFPVASVTSGGIAPFALKPRIR